MTSTNPDRIQQLMPLLPHLDFSADTPRRCELAAYRDYDTVMIPRVQLDLAGIKALRKVLDQAANGIAAYRLRTLDLDATGIDITEARKSLRRLLGVGDPNDLGSIDWVEVGRRLEYCDYGELRKLHALLTADETPAEATS